MSKAFVKESEESPEEPPLTPNSAQLPPDAKNYMTGDGAERMREEIRRLHAQLSSTKNGVAATPSELQSGHRRLAYLNQCLQSAEVVELDDETKDAVGFGAMVLIRDEKGHETAFRIVGVDEIDLDRNWISWLAPLAKALADKRAGDSVQFRAPMGTRQLLVVGVNPSAKEMETRCTP